MSEAEEKAAASKAEKKPSSRRTKVAVLIVTLVALEGLLRLVAGNMQVAPYAFHLDDGRCVGLQPNQALTYTGWLWRIDPVTHDTNSFGFRGPDRPPEKPDGVFRIAALGDSFIYGQGVESADSLPSQLERRLKTTRPKVEVLNFGVPGYGVDEYMSQYRYFIKRWSPDLLLLFLHDSDLDDGMCARIPPDAKGADDGQLSSYVLRAAFMIVKIAGNIAGRVVSDSERADNIEGFTAQMTALRSEAEAAGTRLAVVAIGDPLREEGALNDLLWLHRIPALLDGDAVWKLERIPGETHFTPKGLDDLSGHVETFLTQQTLLPKLDTPPP